MTLQQLRYLIAISEHGSINAAAQSLYISQSNLSTAITFVMIVFVMMMIAGLHWGWLVAFFGAIAAGLLSRNYEVCDKPDAPVCEGDLLSLRGKGKAAVLDAGSRE